MHAHSCSPAHAHAMPARSTNRPRGLHGKRLIDIGCGTGGVGLGASLLGTPADVVLSDQSQVLHLTRRNIARWAEEAEVPAAQAALVRVAGPSSGVALRALRAATLPCVSFPHPRCARTVSSHESGGARTSRRCHSISHLAYLARRFLQHPSHPPRVQLGRGCFSARSPVRRRPRRGMHRAQAVPH